MPAGDGTGPNGMGPMTGRGAGFCTGYSTPGYSNVRIGCGFGRGIRRGFGRRYFPTQTQTNFRASQFNLDDEAEYLKGELDAISKRLQQIKDLKKSEQ